MIVKVVRMENINDKKTSDAPEPYRSEKYI